MTTTSHTATLVTAADNVTTAYAAALAPLVRIAARTPAHPPTIEAGLTAVVHLHAAGPTLDGALSEMFRELIAAGVPRPKLARLLGVRATTMTKLLDSEAVGATAPEITPAAFMLRDKVSGRAARESLIAAAAGMGVAYADALRPVSRLSEGALPEAATVDAALEAVVHLHAARKQLDAALDGVMACLVLGGVKRMALAELLGISANTLQRRLVSHPLTHARHVDLVDEGNGVWSVERAEVGRYAPKPVADEDGIDVEAALNATLVELVGGASSTEIQAAVRELVLACRRAGFPLKDLATTEHLNGHKVAYNVGNVFAELDSVAIAERALVLALIEAGVAPSVVARRCGIAPATAVRWIAEEWG